MSSYSTGDLATRLRARGLRVTVQREQVLAAVRELGHATPEQIGDAVPDADVTTVYRTLELLEELGLVRHTHLGHGAPSYRPAEDDHVHVICHSCGRVFDTDPGLVDSLASRLLADQGFVLDRAHFTVFGRCTDCVALGDDGDGGDGAGDAHGREHDAPGRERDAPGREHRAGEAPLIKHGH